MNNSNIQFHKHFYHHAWDAAEQPTRPSPVLFGQLDNNQYNNIEYNKDNNSINNNDSKKWQEQQQFKNKKQKQNINNLHFYRHALHAAGQSAKAKPVL